MCTPAAAVAIGSQALTAYQQQQQVDAENDYERLLYGQRQEEAINAYAQLNARELQEREAAARDVQRVTQQARQAAGAAQLQALEGGVRGRSVDFLLQTFANDRLEAVETVQRNLAFTAQQLQAQRLSASRITPPRIHQGPFDSPYGLLSLGLGAVGSSLSTPRPAAT